LLAPLGVAAAMIAGPTAGADQQCVYVGAGTTHCASPGNVQIGTMPPPTDPHVRYGCTAGFTSYCDLPGMIIDRPTRMTP
jgi:hypothetical protein